MTTTHTPGPWTVSTRAGKRPATIVRDANENEVCEVYAAADLIAAAPDLLDALRGVMTWWAETSTPNGVDDEMPPKLFDAAWLAIARATRKA